MVHPVRLCLALHNHQPVGNFDHVFQQAYQDSYLPFLEVFENFAPLRMSLHVSGPLAEWLNDFQPEYLNRLAALVQSGRLEILGGAFYEPILTMIPARDRLGQIRSFTQWLESRLGCHVQGMWTPERVWEQSLAKDLAQAGIAYTILDDFHFRNAGLDVNQLRGHFITEDEGYSVSIFPGSERLRYLIPFHDPQETIAYLRAQGEQYPQAVFVFGDDGEKFGTWPDTHRHVYENGWLHQFFSLLQENREWLRTCTLAEAYFEVPAQGRIYLPEGSYREMTEWALPTERQREYRDLVHDMEDDPRWQRILPFVRGGYWRNFKIKYPETHEMYARMMAVSRRLETAAGEGIDSGLLAAARRELYRGQCNCSYWHGAFGGAYLPHLRNAVYHHLIAADNILDQAAHPTGSWVQAAAEDVDFDGHKEIRLENERLIALITPHHGGQLAELDVRSICHNLLATLDRRDEVYHDKVRQGASQAGDACASIHDRIVFKQEGLAERLQHDSYRHKAFVDHFLPLQASLASLADGPVEERGDFEKGAWETRILKNPGRIQVRMQRQGLVDQQHLQLTKGVTLESGSASLEVSYLLEGMSPERPLHLAVECNLSGMPAGLHDRYFFLEEGASIGHLGTRLDLGDLSSIGLADEWLGLRVRLSSSRPMQLWTFPVETVSQSEGGFELVHQSVALVPHWIVQPDHQGIWSVTLTLAVDTSLAEARRHPLTELANV